MGEETWIKETWIKGVQAVRCVWREASNKLAQVYFCWGADRGQWGWVPMPMFKVWTELEKENATDGWILNKIKYRNLIDSGMQNWFDERAAPLWTIKWKGRCVGLFKNLFSGSPQCVVAMREEWPEWSVYNRLSLICSLEGPMWDMVRQLSSKPVLRAGKTTWKNYTVKTHCASVVESS